MSFFNLKIWGKIEALFICNVLCTTPVPQTPVIVSSFFQCLLQAHVLFCFVKPIATQYSAITPDYISLCTLQLKFVNLRLHLFWILLQNFDWTFFKMLSPIM